MDRIQVGDRWYVAATSARAEDSPQVLKHAQTFVLFDRFGDIDPAPIGVYRLQGGDIVAYDVVRTPSRVGD